MKQGKIYRADLYGLRESKYQYLAENDVSTTNGNEIKAQSPYYTFRVKIWRLLTNMNSQ